MAAQTFKNKDVFGELQGSIYSVSELHTSHTVLNISLDKLTATLPKAPPFAYNTRFFHRDLKEARKTW